MEDNHGTYEGLVISHPELQPGLTDVIPPGELPSHYINRYQAEEEVRCAFCDKHTPHKRGFTAQMEDGRIALCGRDCAAKYFGTEAAEKFEAELERQIQRAAQIRVVQRTLGGVPATLALITPELIRAEVSTVDALSSLYLDLRSARLPKIHTDAGDLEVKDSVRRWEEREDEFGRVRRVPIDEWRVTHRIIGASVLNVGQRHFSKFEAARRELTALAGVGRVDGLSEVVVARMVQKRRKIIDDIRNGCRFLNICRKFFTRDNVKALSRLGSERGAQFEKISLQTAKDGGCELVIEGKLLSFASDYGVYGRTQRFSLPNFENLPNADDLLASLMDSAPA